MPRTPCAQVEAPKARAQVQLQPADGLAGPLQHVRRRAERGCAPLISLRASPPCRNYAIPDSDFITAEDRDRYDIRLDTVGGRAPLRDRAQRGQRRVLQAPHPSPSTTPARPSRASRASTEPDAAQTGDVDTALHTTLAQHEPSLAHLAPVLAEIGFKTVAYLKVALALPLEHLEKEYFWRRLMEAKKMSLGELYLLKRLMF
jgi:hypothetical protein